MSAFLGPIHYWLYEKIQKQESLTQRILQAGVPEQERPGILQTLGDACGKVETRPLAAYPMPAPFFLGKRGRRCRILRSAWPPLKKKPQRRVTDIFSS